MKLHEIAEKPAKYKTKMKKDDAWELLNTHCKDAMKSFHTPIVRGMTPIPGGFGLIHGEAGARKSRHTSNHYTVILDAVLPSDYPKRSASMICANWDNLDHADGYGSLYAIFPFDDVKIGVCPDYDIWETEVMLGGVERNIPRWNLNFQDLGVNDTMSFDEMVQHLETLLEENDPAKHKLPDWLVKIKGNVRKAFAQGYSDPFRLATTAESRIYDNDNEDRHELWIGGKCYAINMKLYTKLQQEHMS